MHSGLWWGPKDCLEMRKGFCLLASLQKESSESEKVSPAQPFSYSDLHNLALRMT